ncbi:MAG: PilZ domain-containing protein [Candidatus Acidiferrales bacterium]
MNKEDLRRHERVLVPESCQIRVKGNGKGPQLEGSVSVIGLGGMFVRTKIPPAPGSTHHVVLTCPNVSLESECTVVHVKPNGMGVELTRLTPENEEKLKALLLKLKS